MKLQSAVETSFLTWISKMTHQASYPIIDWFANNFKYDNDYENFDKENYIPMINLETGRREHPDDIFIHSELKQCCKECFIPMEAIIEKENMIDLTVDHILKFPKNYLNISHAILNVNTNYDTQENIFTLTFYDEDNEKCEYSNSLYSELYYDGTIEFLRMQDAVFEMALCYGDTSSLKC